MKDTKSLSHASYRCKYHIVIVPKYRRMIIYNRIRRDIIQILTLLINRKPGVKLIEGGKNMSGSYTYAFGNDTKIFSSKIYGVFEK